MAHLIQYCRFTARSVSFPAPTLIDVSVVAICNVTTPNHPNAGVVLKLAEQNNLRAERHRVMWWNYVNKQKVRSAPEQRQVLAAVGRWPSSSSSSSSSLWIAPLWTPFLTDLPVNHIFHLQHSYFRRGLSEGAHATKAIFLSDPLYRERLDLPLLRQLMASEHSGSMDWTETFASTRSNSFMFASCFPPITMTAMGYSLSQPQWSSRIRTCTRVDRGYWSARTCWRSGCEYRSARTWIFRWLCGSSTAFCCPPRS